MVMKKNNNGSRGGKKPVRPKMAIRKTVSAKAADSKASLKTKQKVPVKAARPAPPAVKKPAEKPDPRARIEKARSDVTMPKKAKRPGEVSKKSALQKLRDKRSLTKGQEEPEADENGNGTDAKGALRKKPRKSASEMESDVSRLIEEGKEKGFLTIEDIGEALSGEHVSEESLEEVISLFGEHDIDIVDEQSEEFAEGERDLGYRDEDGVV